MQTAGLKVFSQEIAFLLYINGLCNTSGVRRTEVVVLKERID